MTTYEYAQFILESKNDITTRHMVDETTAYEVAQLVSGTFIFPLYEALWQNSFDMDAITDHLEAMYDSGNHFGIVYFSFILANAANIIIPLQFSEMSATGVLVPILSAAIIEDWLEYDATHEATECE
jgi:hypothetical protein